MTWQWYYSNGRTYGINAEDWKPKVKTTTQRIKELYEKARGKEFNLGQETDHEAEKFITFTTMKNTNAACMAELLERAEKIIQNIPRKAMEILLEDCPEYDWLADFEKFQRGE